MNIKVTFATVGWEKVTVHALCRRQSLGDKLPVSHSSKWPVISQAMLGIVQAGRDCFASAIKPRPPWLQPRSSDTLEHGSRRIDLPVDCSVVGLCRLPIVASNRMVLFNSDAAWTFR